MYKVFKDHTEIAEYKTLAAAKKLAEKEHGEVFCDGQKVYPTEQDGSADLSTANTTYEGQAKTQPTIEAQSDEAPKRMHRIALVLCSPKRRITRAQLRKKRRIEQAWKAATASLR